MAKVAVLYRSSAFTGNSVAVLAATLVLAPACGDDEKGDADDD